MEQIRNFPLKDIIISEDFKNTAPAEWKLQRKIEHYNETLELPEDIVINDENVLIDGYTTYLVAVRYGITHVPVKRGYVELIEARHRAGQRAYFWRVPTRLIGKARQGDKCIVRTINGDKWVRVANVFRIQYPVQEVQLKNVKAVIQKKRKCS
ncbi:MAG: DUF5839 family protein [Oliverpabstia sp.]